MQAELRRAPAWAKQRARSSIPGMYTLVPGKITAVNGTAPNHTYNAVALHATQVTVSSGTPYDRDANFDYEALTASSPCQLMKFEGSWVISDAYEDQDPSDCAETEGPTISADLITMRVFM